MPQLAPLEPPGGRYQRSPLPDEQDKDTGQIRADNSRGYGNMHNAGSAAASISGKPMWHYNGEDDATRCGRKGPDSATALARILSDLYKGEEEEFLHIKPRDGFSMYNPQAGRAAILYSISIHSRTLYHEYSPCQFLAGTAEGREDSQPISTARGPWPGPRRRT